VLCGMDSNKKSLLRGKSIWLKWNNRLYIYEKKLPISATRKR
jgi:hypothetical protein